MNPTLSLDELLQWNEESSNFWKAHLESHPALLDLPCGIGSAENVQALVRHVWGAELRWAQRLAGTLETPKDAMPSGPLDALFDLHLQADEIFRKLLADPAHDWSATYTLNFPGIPEEKRNHSHRKIAAHALLHGQRHWAQLATLVRAAGLPSGFGGDLLLSSALA